MTPAEKLIEELRENLSSFAEEQLSQLATTMLHENKPRYEDNADRLEAIAMSGPEAPLGDVCSIEGCDGLATEYWYPGVCALREAGITPDYHGLCDKHDVELNETYLRMLCGNKYDAELAAYRKRRLPSPPSGGRDVPKAPIQRDDTVSFTAEHTWLDIVRWIKAEDGVEEVLFYLKES